MVSTDALLIAVAVVAATVVSAAVGLGSARLVVEASGLSSPRDSATVDATKVRDGPWRRLRHQVQASVRGFGALVVLVLSFVVILVLTGHLGSA